MSMVVLAATLIDGTGGPPLKDEAIVVADGRFVQIGPLAEVSFDPTSDQVIDLSKYVLMPGLIDLHCHLFLMGGKSHVVSGYRETIVHYIIRGLHNAGRWLDQGVTTVREMGCKENLDLELRDLIEARGARGPRIFACGQPLTMTAGLRGSAAAMAIEVDGDGEARRAARQQLRAGVDHIKMFATAGIGGGEGRLVSRPGWPQMTEEEMRAVCLEAHKAGRNVAIHAIGTEGIKNAVRAGADTIEHGSFLDDEAIDLMLKHGTALVPTLAIRHNLARNAVALGYEPHIGQRALKSLPITLANHRRAYEAGVQIGVGSDNVDEDTIAQECCVLHKELGLPTAEVIRAATLGNAEILGVAHWLGSIERWKAADLIALDGNPLEDIGALARVRWVLKGGEVVKSADI